MIKRYLSWQDVEEAVERLATNIIASKKEIVNVVGLPRGGLIPAVMLSHKLNVPFISEDDEADTGEGYTLVVDDICDSGLTLHKYNLPTATIHTKETASVQPTFHYEVVDKDWINYPWERVDSKTIADYATERI
jgi:hypoxanthine phosphoribosyltransferase